jgi:hypothetical protein
VYNKESLGDLSEMAVTYTQASSGTNYGGGYSRVNPTTHTYFATQISGAVHGVDWINEKYDDTIEPYALGSGVYVDATGRYLMDESFSPVSRFVVINDSADDIFAGVNAASSGSWATGNGLTIEAGASYEFGGEGTQIIRNVWAMANAGSQSPIQGYAINQREWV